jgi:lipoprotein LprG
MPRPRALLAPLALLTLGVLIAGMAACTRQAEPPTEALPSGATLIADAAAAMRTVSSAHVRIETEGEVSNLPLRRAEGDLLLSGDAKGTIQLSQFGVLVEYEFVMLGESIYLKGATGGWQVLPAAVASTIYDPSAILSPDRGIVTILATAAEPTTEGTETIDGKQTYAVRVKLDSAAVSTLVPGVGAGVTGRLWIDAEKKHLVRAVLAVPGPTADKNGTVTVNVSAIDVPVSISAP